MVYTALELRVTGTTVSSFITPTTTAHRVLLWAVLSAKPLNTNPKAH